MIFTFSKTGLETLQFFKYFLISECLCKFFFFLQFLNFLWYKSSYVSTVSIKKWKIFFHKVENLKNYIDQILSMLSSWSLTEPTLIVKYEKPQGATYFHRFLKSFNDFLINSS